MAANIIDERLKSYALNTVDDEEHALKEILQEVAIYGLSSANFFDKAAFQGGTALRILYGLPRFSEDLDFILKNPDPDFKWESYMEAIIATCKQFGVNPEVTDKSRVNSAVKKMFLKDDSIGKIIDLTFAHHPGRKLTIKLEIDTNPPQGSNYDLKFLEFPLDCSLLAQDLSSSFAGKCHALLCREYIKGRDWYDFGWYVARKITPNFIFLENAINQQGPWANQKIKATPSRFVEALKNKIESIDWSKAASDVEPFLNQADRKVLDLWGVPFFMDKLDKLKSYISIHNRG
jgi:predicted nucleotidyltransferase component of viral defense system